MVTATAEPVSQSRARRGGSVPKKPSAGPIEREASYSLDDFKARTRMSDHAIRTARRRGLTVVVTGGIGFVRGCDWLDYLAKVASGEVK